MRKTVLTLALVVALSGSLSACEGDKGSTGRDVTNEAVSAPAEPSVDTVSVTPDEGDTLSPSEMLCKSTIRPYAISSFEDGLNGTDTTEIGPDAVIACMDLDIPRMQELWVDVIREEYGDTAADMVSASL